MAISFGSLKLPDRPNLPFLNSALVQIGDELNRSAGTSVKGLFSPFGVMDGFLLVDPNAEMAKSIRVPTSGAGILRFRMERAPSLVDLPKLTPSASKPGSRPPKSKPVTFQVTSESMVITEIDAGDRTTVTFDQLQGVRVDKSGRFFFIVAGESGSPLCLKANPWIAPALALLMAGAARKGSLKDLEAEIDKKVRSR